MFTVRQRKQGFAVLCEILPCPKKAGNEAMQAALDKQCASPL